MSLNEDLKIVLAGIHDHFLECEKANILEEEKNWQDHEQKRLAEDLECSESQGWGLTQEFSGYWPNAKTRLEAVEIELVQLSHCRNAKNGILCDAAFHNLEHRGNIGLKINKETRFLMTINEAERLALAILEEVKSERALHYPAGYYDL